MTFHSSLSPAKGVNQEFIYLSLFQPGHPSFSSLPSPPFVYLHINISASGCNPCMQAESQEKGVTFILTLPISGRQTFESATNPFCSRARMDHCCLSGYEGTTDAFSSASRLDRNCISLHGVLCLAKSFSALEHMTEMFFGYVQPPFHLFSTA